MKYDKEIIGCMCSGCGSGFTTGDKLHMQAMLPMALHVHDHPICTLWLSQ